jgi:hypothetical protein
MAEIKQSILYENEQIRSDDGSNLGDLAIESLVQLVQDTLNGANKNVVVHGLSVIADTIPSQTVYILPGTAFDTKKNIYSLTKEGLSPNTALPVSVELTGEKRIDNVEIMAFWKGYDLQPRKFKNVTTEEVTTQQVETKKRKHISAIINKGTASSAPPVTEGYIKIAEIHVDESTTSISDSNIKNITASISTEINDLWTHDRDSIYLIGYLDTLKVRMNGVINAEGFLKEKVIHEVNIDYGIEDGQVNSLQLPVGEDIAFPLSGDVIEKNESVASALQTIATKAESGNGGNVQFVSNHELNFDLVTGTNIILSENNLYFPLENISIEEKFINNNWASLQDQLNAGYPLFYEPSSGSGNFEGIIDFEEIVAEGRIVMTADWSSTNVSNELFHYTLSFSADKVSWLDFENQAIINAQNFRYIKVSFSAKNINTHALFILYKINLALYKVLISEKGEKTITVIETPGALVSLQNSYNHYALLVEAYSENGVYRKALYWKNDNKSFYVKIIDENNNQVEGTIAYMAEEY